MPGKSWIYKQQNQHWSITNNNNKHTACWYNNVITPLEQLKRMFCKKTLTLWCFLGGFFQTEKQIFLNKSGRNLSHQVLCEIVDELSVVQTFVLVEVVLKHGCDLLRPNDRSTHSHRIFTRLKNSTSIDSRGDSWMKKLKQQLKLFLVLLYLHHLSVWVHQVQQ